MIDSSYIYYIEGQYKGEVHCKLGTHASADIIVIATGIEDSIKNVCKIVDSFYDENEDLLGDYLHYEQMGNGRGMDYVLYELDYPKVIYEWK